MTDQDVTDQVDAVAGVEPVDVGGTALGIGVVRGRGGAVLVLPSMGRGLGFAGLILVAGGVSDGMVAARAGTRM